KRVRDGDIPGLVVPYEQLVCEPASTMEKVCGYLEITFDPQTFLTPTKVGRFWSGNSAARIDFSQLSSEPATRWQRELSDDNPSEMSGILFDLLGLRFLRRFRFFETMVRTFASSLLRWLSARACGWRQLHFRLHEAEFSSASQSACKLFEWTLGDSRATDGASIDALRPSNNWVNLKDQHELLLIRETPAPFA